MIILPHGALVLEEAARHGSPYGRMPMRRILKAVFLNAMLAIAGNDVRAQGVSLPSAFITGQAVCPKTPERNTLRVLWTASSSQFCTSQERRKRIGEMPGWAGQQANWCKLVEVHSGAARGAA